MENEESGPVTVKSRLTFDGPRGPLFKALAEARSHYTSLSTDATADVANKEGKHLYTFKYAPLDVVLEAIRPGLEAAGLALSQPFDGDSMYTIVACGESSMTVETPLPTWDTPQQLGSLLTYLRRYQIKGIFGVADAEDDDGNAASGNSAKIDRKQPQAPNASGPQLNAKLRADITAAAKARGWEQKVFYAQATAFAQKPWADYTQADGEAFLAAIPSLQGPT